MRAPNTPGQELTFTVRAARLGSPHRRRPRRRRRRDRDELDAGTDPADPTSVPGGLDQLLVGRKVLIKNKLPDDESKNQIVVLTKDAAVAIPAPGSVDDPRCGTSASGTAKARVTVRSASTAEVHATDMPCQNWSLIGTETAPKGYKYKDKELDDGTAKTAVWKPGKLLKVVLQGKGPTDLDFDLQVGTAEAPVDVTIRSGARRVCLHCNASKGKDGSDGRVFQGKDPDCPAPLACVGSASAAFLDP